MEKIDFNDIVSIDQGNKLLYCAKSLDNGDWVPILACQPAYYRTVEINGELYRDDRYITIYSDRNICSLLSKEKLYSIIREAIVFITSRGLLVDIPKEDYYLNQYLDALDSVSLVKDVISFPYNGEIPLDDEIMQKLCIEKPIRNTCINLSKNGIKTLMSSANAENITNRDVRVDEQRIYIGQNDAWTIGNGYAWIMMDWDELSNENKQYLISIRNNEIDLNLNENEVKNLRHNSELNGKKGLQDELIKFYEYVDVSREIASSFDFDSEKVVKHLYLSPLSKDAFYDLNKLYLLGHNSLNNHLQNSSNHFRTVVIRYPMDKFTTIADVENFYNRISLEMIKNQKNKLDNGRT